MRERRTEPERGEEVNEVHPRDSGSEPVARARASQGDSSGASRAGPRWRRKRGLAIAATLALGLRLWWSGGTTQAAAGRRGGLRRDDGPPITSIVASVGGDLVQINGLIEGADSHTFEPPPSVP